MLPEYPDQRHPGHAARGRGSYHRRENWTAGRRGSLRLRFADTGPGIPPEDREKVFTPFYSTKATGFGLGLAITKKIVEDHGGRVFATDGTSPGTVVVMELPEPGTRDSANGTRATEPAIPDAVRKA